MYAEINNFFRFIHKIHQIVLSPYASFRKISTTKNKTKAKLPFDSPAGMILLAIILKLTFNVLTLCTVHR